MNKTNEYKGKSPRHRNQRPTHFHTHGCHKNTKQEATENLYRFPQALCILPLSLWVHMRCSHVELEGLVSLVTPSGSYTLSAYSASGSLNTVERDLMETSHLGLSVLRYLTLCIMSGCGSLYLFPSAAGGSFSEDDWARHWSMSIAECH